MSSLFLYVTYDPNLADQTTWWHEHGIPSFPEEWYLLDPNVQRDFWLKIAEYNEAFQDWIDDVYDGKKLIYDSSIWLGKLSWADAATAGDYYDQYVPGPLWGVYELMLGTPEINKNLITAVMVAMNRSNRSIYKAEQNRGIAAPRQIKQWLQKNMGGYVFIGTEEREVEAA